MNAVVIAVLLAADAGASAARRSAVPDGGTIATADRRKSDGASSAAVESPGPRRAGLFAVDGGGDGGDSRGQGMRARGQFSVDAGGSPLGPRKGGRGPFSLDAGTSQVESLGPRKGGRGPDAGISQVDSLGPRKGGRGQFFEAPAVRVESSLSASWSSDAGYSGATLPADVAVPTLNVHVFASEELGPDALRKLARPSVTLWLDTKTNMLRESTMDVLRAGGASYVRVRPPLVEAHQRRFATLRSGVWVDAAELSALSLHWVGTRPVAVEVNGTGDWAAVSRVRPSFVFWAKPGCDEGAWSAAKALKGRVVTVEATPCAFAGPPVIASYRGAAPSTEKNPFIWIRPDAAPAQVRDLYVRNAATQLLVSVGERSGDVRKLAALLDAFERKR